MKKGFVAFILLLSCCKAFSQRGPHSALNKVWMVKFSNDKTKFLSATYQDIALWDVQTGKPIWHKTFAELYLDNSIDLSFRIHVSANLNYMHIRNTPHNLLINTQTLEIKYVNPLVDDISDGGIGLYNDVNNKKSWTTDFVSPDWTLCKGLKGSGNFTPDGKKIIEYDSDKKHLSYDIAEKKTKSEKGNYWDIVREKKESDAPYKVDLTYRPGPMVTVAGSGSFKPKYGGFSIAEFFVCATRADSSLLFLKEQVNNYTAGEGSVYQEYVVCYHLPDGNVVREIQLSGTVEQAKIELEKINKEKQEKDNAEKEKLAQLMTNAKPGFKEFDAQFTDLVLPYTMNYDNAQGFSMGYSDFVKNAVILNDNNSQLFGMGRVCSCNEYVSYLFMVRTKTQTSDRSNFIVMTYKVDGTYVYSENIGTTQKDASETITTNFTISGNKCGVQVKSKMTHGNGYADDKSVSLPGCVIN